MKYFRIVITIDGQTYTSVDSPIEDSNEENYVDEFRDLISGCVRSGGALSIQSRNDDWFIFPSDIVKRAITHCQIISK